MVDVKSLNIEVRPQKGLTAFYTKYKDKVIVVYHKPGAMYEWLGGVEEESIVTPLYASNEGTLYEALSDIVDKLLVEDLEDYSDVSFPF